MKTPFSLLLVCFLKKGTSEFSRIYLSVNAKEIFSWDKNVPWCSLLGISTSWAIQLHVVGLATQDAVVTRGKKKLQPKSAIFFCILYCLGWTGVGFSPRPWCLKSLDSYSSVILTKNSVSSGVPVLLNSVKDCLLSYAFQLQFGTSL